MARPLPPSSGGEGHLPWSRWFDKLADRLTGNPATDDPLPELLGVDGGIIGHINSVASDLATAVDARSQIVVEDPDTGWPPRPDVPFVTWFGVNDPPEQRVYDRFIAQAGWFYSTDFSSYALDAEPSDWTDRWTASTWRVRDTLAGARGGRNLQRTSESTRGLLSWDKLGDAHDDVEVVARVHGIGGTGVTNGILLRASSSSPTENAYAASGRGHNNLSLSRYVGGTWTELDQATGAIADTSGFWWIRFRAQGTDLKVKGWVDGDDEPAAWQIEETDTSHATGWVGVGGNSFHWIDFVSIATGGESAVKAGL